jgi:hypothetical protein
VPGIFQRQEPLLIEAFLPEPSSRMVSLLQSSYKAVHPLTTQQCYGLTPDPTMVDHLPLLLQMYDTKIPAGGGSPYPIAPRPKRVQQCQNPSRGGSAGFAQNPVTESPSAAADVTLRLLQPGNDANRDANGDRTDGDRCRAFPAF